MKANKCKNGNLMKISNSKAYFWDLAYYANGMTASHLSQNLRWICDNFTNVVRATLFVNNLCLSYNCRTTGIRATSVVRPFVNSPKGLFKDSQAPSQHFSKPIPPQFSACDSTKSVSNTDVHYIAYSSSMAAPFFT